MKYNFITVEFDNNRVFESKMAGAEHQSILNEQAALGNRYVGWIPTVWGPSGKLIKMDLVFEEGE